MQAPRPQGMGIQMRGLPGAQGGAFTNADTFGAARHRQQQQLAKAGLYASVSMIDEDQNRRAKEDSAFVDQAIVNAKTRIASEQQGIYDKFKGVEVHKAPDEIAKMMQRIQHDIDGGFLNEHQRNRFTSAFQAMTAQETTKAYNFRDQQIEALRISAGKDIIDGAMEEGEGLVTIASGYKDAMSSPQLAVMLAKTNELTEGLPEEMRSSRRKKVMQSYYQNIITTAGTLSPEMALQCLEEDAVKKLFNEAELKELKDKYRMAESTTAIARAAIEAVDSNLTPDQIYMKSLDYENDKERNAFLTETTNYQNRKVLAARTEKAAYHQQIEDEFAKSGYTTIPARAMQDRELYSSLFDFKSKLVAFKGERAIPNEQFLIDLYNKSPEEIDAYLAEGNNFSEYLMNLAGDSEWKTAILNKRKGIDSGDDGRGGVYGGLDVADMIEGDFIRLQGYEGYISDTEYDSSEARHKRTKNNLLHQFRKRWRDKENYYPNAKPDERAENIYFDMIRENREGKLKLNDPSYDIEMETRLQKAADNPRFESINPKTGKTEVTFRDGDSTKTFIKIDASAFGDRGIRDAYQVPDDAEPGTYNGADYQPGDHIGVAVNRRTGREDITLVYDRNWNLRSNFLNLEGARRGQLSGPTLPPERKEPAKTLKMLDWERQNNTTFTWQKLANRFVARKPSVNDPNSEAVFEANPEGTMIDSVPFGGITDETFESMVEKPPEAGEEILEKIAALENEIAVMDRDPRTRKDVAAAKAAEIEELKAEYDRVTGKNVKESELYVPGK